MTDVAIAIFEASRLLLAAKRVVVCAHVHPDGDAIGATLGATLALREAGIDAVPTIADEGAPPTTYAFLPGFDLFVPVASLEAPDVFLALDAPSWDRLGAGEPLARVAGAVVAIDHHPDNARFCEPCVVDDTAAATGQILWHMLPSLGVKPTPDIAMCLYVALMSDTGRFSYGNTDARALRDAAAMIDAGADAFAAYTAVYEHRSAGYLRLLGLTLSRVTHANGGRVAYSWISSEDLVATGALVEETEDLVDVVRTVADVDAVALFKVESHQTRMSLRAKGPYDVGAAARILGGGGHHAASGATVSGGLDAALAAALPLLPGGGS